METPENSKQLFSQLNKGDENAFENLYQLYFPRLLSFSRKIVGDEVLSKDVIQNVFIKIWENPEYLKKENPEALLFKMVRNASLNFIRHLKVVENLKVRAKEHYLGEELYYIDLVGDEPVVLIEEELRRNILGVMDSLPPMCKKVFQLSRIQELKNKEIAEKLGISIKSVEKHISKALVVYRKKFSGLFPAHIIFLVLKDYLS